jgi:hypothetical protein
MKETRQPASQLLSFASAESKNSMDFLIAEYTALRGEILKRTEIQHQLISITLVVLGSFLSLVDKIPAKVFLAYPILALFLSAAWSQSDIRIRQIGAYVKEHIEERLIQEKLLDNRSGWEHVFQTLSPVGKLGTLSQLTSLGILIGTQILSVILFVFKRLRPPSFTKGDIGLLVLDCVVIFFTAVLLRGSQRWFSNI